MEYLTVGLHADIYLFINLHRNNHWREFFLGNNTSKIV